MTLTAASVGLRFASSGRVSGLTILNSHLDGNSQGLCVYADGGITNNQIGLTNVAITDTTFDNNVLKGIYVEKLDSAVLQRVSARNSGTSGASSAGIDVNLKYGAYTGLQILNSTITGCGAGDPTNGVGLTIKARNDGSYASKPATLTNVLVQGCVVTGNQAGVRFGEPAKNNAGPTTPMLTQCLLSANSGGATRYQTTR